MTEQQPTFSAAVGRKWLSAVTKAIPATQSDGWCHTALRFSGANIELRAVAGGIEMLWRCDCDMSGCGDVTVKTEHLLMAVNRIKSAVIDIDYNGENLALSGGGISCDVEVMQEDQSVPEVVSQSSSQQVVVNAEALQDAIEFVYPALGTDKAFRELTCLQVSCDDGMLRLVSTDGKRLHTAAIPWDGAGVGEQKPVLVCPEFVKLLRRERHAAGLATVSFSDPIAGSVPILSVATGCGYFATRTLDGGFPDWKRVASKPNKLAARVIDLPAADVASAMKAVIANTDKKFRAVLVRVHHGVLTFRTHTPLLGGTTDYSFDAGSGDEFGEMGLSAQYIMDIVKPLGKETVTMALYNPYEPVRFASRALGTDWEKLAVLMPVVF